MNSRNAAENPTSEGYHNYERGVSKNRTRQMHQGDTI